MPYSGDPTGVARVPRKTHPPRDCSFCGDSFIPQERGKRGAARRFCSVPCARRSDAAAARGKPKKRRPTEDRYWEYVGKNGDNGCWTWHGPMANGGYGCMRVGGKPGSIVRAHRLSYEIHFGPIPEGMWVLHHCDNPPCSNPEHLYLGDQTLNMRDMVARGRRRPDSVLPRGSAHPHSKMDEEMVRDIRRMWAAGASVDALAERAGVSRASAWAAATGRTWRHVDAVLG